MTSPPALFDTDLLARRRARAARMGWVDFLQHEVAEDISERLTAVNRTFRDIAIVGPRGELWAEVLGAPGAVLVPAEDRLALQEAAFDLVVHALALHWANDPVGQLIQARRALRPDGLFVAALLGGSTLSELRAALTDAEAAVTGGLSPRVAPMGDIRDLGGLLQRAGLSMPVADSREIVVSYASALALMHDLRGMGETNVMVDRLRRPTRRSVLLGAAADYALRAALPDGRVRATFDVVFLTGWAPDASQPKPLRPGSAAARLADALGKGDPEGAA